jgi:hypothetical protein
MAKQTLALSILFVVMDQTSCEDIPAHPPVEGARRCSIYL